MSKPKSKEITFEEGLVQIESLLKSLEAENVPLESLLEKFEEGKKLLKVCKARLKEAQLKIKKMEADDTVTDLSTLL